MKNEEIRIALYKYRLTKNPKKTISLLELSAELGCEYKTLQHFLQNLYRCPDAEDIRYKIVDLLITNGLWEKKQVVS